MTEYMKAPFILLYNTVLLNIASLTPPLPPPPPFNLLISNTQKSAVLTCLVNFSSWTSAFSQYLVFQQNMQSNVILEKFDKMLYNWSHFIPFNAESTVFENYLIELYYYRSALLSETLKCSFIKVPQKFVIETQMSLLTEIQHPFLC